MFLLINKINALNLIFQRWDWEVILMNLGSRFGTALNSIWFLATINVFFSGTPLNFIEWEGVGFFGLIGWGREVINLRKILGLFCTFFKEHNFGDFLEVDLVFDGKPFKANFGGIGIFIFGLDFYILKDIRIFDREVVKTEGEVFVLHVLKKIQT